MKRGALILLAALGVYPPSLGCGSASKGEPTIVIPARPLTAGDALMPYAPLGADFVLEVDLARLRANEVLGPLFAFVSPPPELADLDLLGHAASILLCVYDLADDPKQLIILEAKGDRLGEASRLAQGFYALGDEALVGQAQAMAANPWEDSSMVADRKLMAARARAMPEEVPSASARMAARLDFNARVAIAGKLALDAVPVRIEAWVDAVDDLAFSVALAAEDRQSALDLKTAIKALVARMSNHPLVRRLGLHRSLGGLNIELRNNTVHTLWVIAPQRLVRVVDLLRTELGAPNND